MNEKSKPIIGLMAALADEVKPVVRHFKLKPNGNEFVGLFENRGIAVELVCRISGIGSPRAIRMYEQLRKHHQPSLVIHFGFAGGLDPTLTSGQAMRFPRIINEAGDAIAIGRESRPRTVDANASPRDEMTLLTLDRLVECVEQKAALFNSTGAHACDMETFAVAKTAAQHDDRLLVIRAITDTATDSLPRGADTWHDEAGTLLFTRVMRHVVRHPQSVGRLRKLQQASNLASRAICEQIGRVIEELTDSIEPYDE